MRVRRTTTTTRVATTAGQPMPGTMSIELCDEGREPMPGTMPDSDDVGCDHRWQPYSAVVGQDWGGAVHESRSWGLGGVDRGACPTAEHRADHRADGRGAGGAVRARNGHGWCAAGTDRYGGAWRDGDEDGDKLVCPCSVRPRSTRCGAPLVHNSWNSRPCRRNNAHMAGCGPDSFFCSESAER
jgi:hypothetical protein